MVADNSGGEGMFTPFTFLNGQTYTVTVNFSASGATGTLHFAAANSLYQYQNPLSDEPPNYTFYGCQSGTQSNSNNQTIGSVTNTSTSPATFTYTAGGGNNGKYTQFWMYTTYASGSTFTSQVTAISVCPVCNISTPTGLAATNGGTTLSWNAVNGAASYSINVTDVHNGFSNLSTLTTTSTFIDFCPLGSGDNVSFTVEPVCANGGTGPLSGTYSFSYTSSSLSTPAGLSYIYNSNLSGTALSWNPVSGAWGYDVLLQDVTANSGINSSAGYTTTNGISANALQLINGHVYNAAIIAQSCSFSAQSAWYQFTAGYCDPVDNVTISNIGNNPFQVSVQLSSNGGISPTSYTARLDEYTPNYQIGVSYLYNLTSTSFNMSVPVIGGTYVVNVQSVCGTSTTNWYPSGSPTYIYSVSSPLTQSSDSSIVNPAIQSPTFGIYPVPASSQVNLIYTSTQTGKANIVIVNEIGIPVIRKAISFVIGQNSCSFDITQLANGIYFVKMFDGKNVYIQKLLIQK